MLKIYKAFIFSIWSKDQQRTGIRLSLMGQEGGEPSEIHLMGKRA